MNRLGILLLAAASALCLCRLPRTGTDAAKLLPAQVLVIGGEEGAVCIESDNGASGCGATLSQALRQMEQSAEGTLFLDTAEHIVLLQSARGLLPQVVCEPELRPAAKLYIAQMTELDAEQARLFLQAHPGRQTLARAYARLLRQEDPTVPVLLAVKGGGLAING